MRTNWFPMSILNFFNRLSLIAVYSFLVAGTVLVSSSRTMAQSTAKHVDPILLEAAKQLAGRPVNNASSVNSNNRKSDSKPLKLAFLSGNESRKEANSQLGTDSADHPRAVFDSNCLVWSANQIHQKSKPYDKHINRYSRKFNIDTDLVKAVITTESCFKKKALSSAGAQGLMQLIPDTAKRFGVKNSYDPRQNIRGGITYLRFLFDRYKGELKKILAAYNAGEGAVDRYKGIPPYRETRDYVKSVLKIYDRLSPNDPLRRSGKRVSAIYYPPKAGDKPGRFGWEYNKRMAPHLYKQ